MALNGDKIFQAQVRQFGMQSSMEAFKSEYLRALNNVVVDLANDLNEAVLTVGNVTDPINLPVYAQAALDMGLARWLIQFGNKAGKLDFETALQLYKDTRAELRMYLELVAQRALTSTASDGTTIVGAGQIGLTK